MLYISILEERDVPNFHQGQKQELRHSEFRSLFFIVSLAFDKYRQWP